MVFTVGIVFICLFSLTSTQNANSFIGRWVYNSTEENLAYKAVLKDWGLSNSSVRTVSKAVSAITLNKNDNNTIVNFTVYRPNKTIFSNIMLNSEPNSCILNTKHFRNIPCKAKLDSDDSNLNITFKVLNTLLKYSFSSESNGNLKETIYGIKNESLSGYIIFTKQ